MIHNITKLFAGIDSSKKTNQCCILDDSGHCVRETCVDNNLSGAHKLETILAEQARNLEVKAIKVATEATDFYDFHILEFLASSETLQEYQTQFYRFNPRVIKAFKPSLRLRDKTDPKDAYAIAEYLRFQAEHAEEYKAKLEHLPLQRLTRFRCHLVKQLAREKNYFLNQLFLKPIISQILCFWEEGTFFRHLRCQWYR